MDVILRGTKAEVVIGPNRPTVIIGNRLDASRNPDAAAAAQKMDWQWFQSQATAQVEDGADVILLNLGHESVDEVSVLPAVIEAVAKVVPSPFCICTGNPQALQMALDVCPGKPLFYYVSAEDQFQKQMLPILVESNAAIVTVGENQAGLPYEFDGLPIQFDVNLELARMVLRKTLAVGVSRDDILLGVRPVCLADDPDCVVSTLALIKKMAQIEQIGFVLEPDVFISGMAEPAGIVQAFVSSGVMVGVACVIADPASVVGTIRAMDTVLNKRPA